MANFNGLRELCNEIFKEMSDVNKAIQNESHGFHFSYSPEKSWKPNIKVLFLTLNPQSSDGNGQNKDIIPTMPWPRENEFLEEANKFRIKKNALVILAEIAGAVLGKNIDPVCSNEDLRNFVDENIILASFVPFRTNSSSEITKPMKEFAIEKYWNKLLPILQPNLIITTGSEAFSAIKKLLEMQSGQKSQIHEKKVCDFHSPDINPSCKGIYKRCDFKMPSGKVTHLIGIPHPAAKFGRFGFPLKNGAFGSGNAPIQKFLREELKKIAF